MYFKPLDNLNTGSLNRIPALSYPKLADSIINGIIVGLKEKGYSEEMAISFITSSILRHELDEKLEDALFDFGNIYAQTVASIYFETCKNYAEEK